MTDMTNAQAALIAASHSIRHTSVSSYGRSTGSYEVSETPTAPEIIKAAEVYLEWLNRVERGTLEERVTRLEESA
jgi:hypothetical protein